MGRKVLLVLLYLYALIFSVIRTIRFPNDWSEAHWMLDYRFGFIKRGLAGEVFGWLLEKNESNILILSIFILLVLYTSILVIAVKETFKNEYNIYRILFYLIFFLSQYIVFSAHLIGYLDHVVFLLTLLIISFIRQKKIFLSSILASVCILIHEISFFLMLPVSFFALITVEASGTRFTLKNIFTPKMIKKTALLFALPLVAIFLVSMYQQLHGENYFTTIFNYLRHTGFISEKTSDSVASAYTKSFSYYFAEEREHFFQRLLISKCTIFYGIPILFLLWMVYKEFKGLRFFLFFLLSVISFFPLLLHAIAYDTFRIWSFPYMILFLGTWVLSLKFNHDTYISHDLSRIEIVAFIISFLLVTLIPNNLFDGEVERFSLIERLILLLPLYIGIYFIIKKPQLKID